MPYGVKAYNKYVVKVNNFFRVNFYTDFVVIEYLPERLKELRGNRSQKAVAEAVGIKQQEWARYEIGTTVPRADKLQQICRNLSASADWLLGLSSNRGGVTNTATAEGAGAQAVAGGTIRNGDPATVAILERLAALEAKVAGSRTPPRKKR